ncbi:polyprenol monophosphomannose synthase [bacterium]|nr:polyprenol monophosphomannose synthase [bacterium]
MQATTISNWAKYLVIIPTYNEAENIVPLIEKIIKQYSDIDILVIDDNSPDRTAELVKNFQEDYPEHIFLLERQAKLGLGSAYQEGFAWGLKHNYDYLISMDADFSHNPEDISHLIKEQSYDIVLASRKIKGSQIVGWNSWRHFTSNGAMWFSRMILGIKTQDVTAGFKCYNQKFLEFLLSKNIKSNGYAFQIETIFLAEKNNFKVKEIATTFVDRAKGKSKLSLKDAIEFFINVFKLKFTPLNKFKSNR